MLDSREFDALPILGDALEEAGCDDSKLLALCRNPDLEPVPAARAVNLAYSDETAAAVRWLEWFAQDIGYEDEPPLYTYEDIVGAGHEAVRTGGYCWGTDARREFFFEDANRRVFFRNWSLVTGVVVSQETQDGIAFRCAC
jgi:hypothetical protein